MTGIYSLLLLVVGTCLFMVAGLVVCIAISIFVDTINIGGAFDEIAGKVIAVVFVPILLAGRALDLVLWFFEPEYLKEALTSDQAIPSRPIPRTALPSASEATP